MKRNLLLVFIFFSLLLVACKENKENNDKEPSVKYEEVIFHLDDSSWDSEGNFRVDSNNELNEKVVSIVSKEYNIDKTKFDSERIFIKNIENDIYVITDALVSSDPWEKASNDYDYVIIANKDIDDNENYNNFFVFANSLKSKGKYIKLDDNIVSVYERIEYAKDIDVIKVQKDEVLTFNALYKKGYKFNGWHDDKGNVLVEFTQDSNTNEFYPSFSLERYTISYYYNGGSSNISPVSEYTYESEDITLFTDLVKEGYKFEGWYDNEEFNGDKVYSINKNSFGNKSYYAKWLIKEIADYTDEEKVDYAITQLVNDYNDLNVINSNITLKLKDVDTNANISWKSNNENALSSEGVYTRQYQITNVTLTATVSLSDVSKSTSFEVSCEGFKNINKIGIASSYIYRNFDKVDDLFFDTLDIINCAFAKGNANGTVTGSNFFKVCKEKIIPKAHEQGDWVVMSIAPDSEWVTLCNPDNGLVDKFCDNIVAAINEYGFDGVDIDWECPTTSQKTWFTNLAKTLYTKVKKNNPNHIVSAAIGGGRWQPPYYDMTNSVKYLDFVNMMTYGMTSSSGQYHNSLYKNSSYHDSTNKCGYTLVSCSIVESIEIYDSYNVPHSKIIVGLAFYGIKQSREYDSSNNTYGSWGKGGSIFYTTIKNNYLNNSDYTYVYDTRCGVPYLISKDRTVFISFDDVRSIKEKCNYILDHKIGGVMYWENGCDTTGDLIGAINSVLS